ncbi:GTP pyrophosphokinase [Planctomicrobium piriforme]|uniref:PpGpp synthetase catalytic domain-containing protein (RelA/SpoT-type nucleotidyltranferase) n=1 Tax=Planctomicrobium piriforme TaxID=1576369 RepID=A0A1I3M676_9PLAN|nr:hypothetical protein [Planctomicrobium piriforme]SFI92186.1 ppGpp synthetase catalytic domain-containing protein (RelA/SpoT-type nucleotidyltranferase) [Planctomicrobium piriforme]
MSDNEQDQHSTTDHFKIQYQDCIGLAERLREAVVEQVSELLKANGVTLGVPIESRVKTWNSIADKFDRKRLEIKNINELEDLVGVRIILLFRRDLENANRLLSNSFNVISSEDTAERLSESEFGYQSQHFVVQLPANWLSVPSLSGLGTLFVELQIRTLAQHIWAAASHKLQYKQKSGVPLPLRRTINRVSALLETVDLEFDRVLEERTAYVETTQSANSETDPLNVDNLRTLLSDLLPSENKSTDENYANLLQNLFHFKINTPEQLRSIIGKHLNAIYASEVKELKKARAHPSEHDTTRLDRGVFFTHVGLAREALRAEFGNQRVNNILTEMMSDKPKRRVSRKPKK